MSVCNYAGIGMCIVMAKLSVMSSSGDKLSACVYVNVQGYV